MSPDASDSTAPRSSTISPHRRRSPFLVLRDVILELLLQHGVILPDVGQFAAQFGQFTSQFRIFVLPLLVCKFPFLSFLPDAILQFIQLRTASRVPFLEDADLGRQVANVFGGRLGHSSNLQGF
jgi:hypothetical protein